MKRVFYCFICIISLVAIFSCSEDFSPKGELPDKISVNLVLRGDTTVQFAYVSRVYDVAGYDPNALTEDPAVDGAVISIKYTDDTKEYFFRDTTDANNLNTRYNSPAKYYYLKNFWPQYGREIELNVNLPNGQHLSSKTIVPNNIIFDVGKTTQIIFTPPGHMINYDSIYINVFWNNSSLDQLKAKKVVIGYFHIGQDGNKTWYIKHVPIASNQETQSGLDYNELSFRNETHIERKLIEQALREIAGTDTKKSSYYIAPLKVSILSLDNNLTKYFRSNLYFDYGFSIRNFPGDYSNVNDGLGFFASYSQISKMVHFDEKYLKNNFGYSMDSTYLTKPY